MSMTAYWKTAVSSSKPVTVSMRIYRTVSRTGRLKEVTPEGERIFYQDGEPCDLPESTRLDVRVEMPQGSVWNVKQRELAEQMEHEQAERKAQEIVEQAGDAEE
ncbi:Uncharacterised protein [Morganella morganii]|nr:Uncharacterised protein [Morganella morganii]